MIEIEPGKGEDFIVEHAHLVIGKAGFYRFPEVGLIFRPDTWRREFATEALQVVIHRAFEVHFLEAALADVDPRNTATIRMLTRLGFHETGRRERTWFVGNQWCDSVDLLLDRRSWQAMEARGAR